MKTEYKDKMVKGDYDRKMVEEETKKTYKKVIETDPKFKKEITELLQVFGPQSKEVMTYVMNHVTKSGYIKDIESKILKGKVVKKEVNTKVDFESKN